MKRREADTANTERLMVMAAQRLAYGAPEAMVQMGLVKIGTSPEMAFLAVKAGKILLKGMEE